MRAWFRLSLLGTALLSLSGCALFAPALTVEQAVARLVPNDPAQASAPDHLIGDQEIQLATELWIKRQPVPRTGGKRIDDGMIQKLVLLWTQGAWIP